jgi:hypothetical protein
LVNDEDEITEVVNIHSQVFTLTVADTPDTDKSEIVYNATTDTIDFNFL